MNSPDSQTEYDEEKPVNGKESPLSYLYRNLSGENFEEEIDRYRDYIPKEVVEVFEEKRNPLEYFKDFYSDFQTLKNQSEYGETGIELFYEFKDEKTEEALNRAVKAQNLKYDLQNDKKKKALTAAVWALNTNIGREVAMNFIAYKPRGPYWDIVGGTYGFCKGIQLEILERDIDERIENFWNEKIIGEDN